MPGSQFSEIDIRDAQSKASLIKNEKPYKLEGKRYLSLNEQSFGKNRSLILKDCIIEELKLVGASVKSLIIVDCKIKKLSLESINGIQSFQVINSKIDHLSFVRNTGFKSIELSGVSVKEGRFLQNNGVADSNISIDLETNKMNKLDVMYNYASNFDLRVSGKMRSLHLRRNNFDNIEFKNASSPHTSIKVKSA